jgi:DNA-binding transcriptional MocR family regulator
MKLIESCLILTYKRLNSCVTFVSRRPTSTLKHILGTDQLTFSGCFGKIFFPGTRIGYYFEHEISVIIVVSSATKEYSIHTAGSDQIIYFLPLLC